MQLIRKHRPDREDAINMFRQRLAGARDTPAVARKQAVKDQRDQDFYLGKIARIQKWGDKMKDRGQQRQQCFY